MLGDFVERPRVASILLVVLVLTMLPHNAKAVSTYNLQVGAYGDDDSIGNMGVRAEIRTNIYHVNYPDEDTFWVGNILSNSAFIQFGYIIEHSGRYCSNATVMLDTSIACSGDYISVDGSEVLLFWAYSPSNSDVLFYYGLTRHVLVGINASWHVYSIVADRTGGGWVFLVDNKDVAHAVFPVSSSSDRIFIVAEKAFRFGQITNSTRALTPGRLGPVEFRNIAYLKDDNWHFVTELYAIVNCGVNPTCPPIPYGVSLVEPNHIIAGTSIPRPNDKQLLWSKGAQGGNDEPDHRKLILISLGAVIAVFAVVVVTQRIIRQGRNRKTH